MKTRIVDTYGLLWTDLLHTLLISAISLGVCIKGALDSFRFGLYIRRISGRSFKRWIDRAGKPSRIVGFMVLLVYDLELT